MTKPTPREAIEEMRRRLNERNAQIERLRAALEKIADPKYGGPFKEIARAALRAKENE